MGKSGIAGGAVVWSGRRRGQSPLARSQHRDLHDGGAGGLRPSGGPASLVLVRHGARRSGRVSTVRRDQCAPCRARDSLVGETKFAVARFWCFATGLVAGLAIGAVILSFTGS